MNHFQSNLCLLFGEMWSCKVVNSLYSERGEKKLVIGGGMVGVIRKVKIFSYPKIKSEALLNVRFASKDINDDYFLENDKCRPFEDQLCPYCDIESPTPDTDFRSLCYPTCPFTNWVSSAPQTCRPCSPPCLTCYGPSPYHCLSCLDPVHFDFRANGTTCLETCGDGIMYDRNISGH
jgi:hypothetical protein